MKKLIVALLAGAALLTQTGCLEIVAEDEADRQAYASEGYWYDSIGSWFVSDYDSKYYVDEWVVEDEYWVEEDYWVEEEYWLEDDSYYDEYYDEWYCYGYYDDDWYYDDESYYEDEWYEDDDWDEDEWEDEDWEDGYWDYWP